MVSEKAVEVAAKAARLRHYKGVAVQDWESVPDPTKDEWRDVARAALSAALPVMLGEAVAWQYRRGPIFPWVDVHRSSARVLVGDGDEYRPLYTLPTPESAP